jgi:hypothetical protein
MILTDYVFSRLKIKNVHIMVTVIKKYLNLNQTHKKIQNKVQIKN